MSSFSRRASETIAAAAILVVLVGCDDRHELRGSLSADSRFWDQYLDGTNPHRFVVELEAEQAVRLAIDQSHVDVEVRVLGGPDPLVIDLPTGRQVPERVCLVSDIAGRYIVEVSPFVGSGHYALEVIRLGPATSAERSCVEGQRDFIRAQEAARTDARASAALFASSAKSFERAGEGVLAAVSHREAASALANAGESGRAVESFEIALVRLRQEAPSFLEVSLLNRLGLACRDLGDFECASSRFEEARLRAQEIGDDRGLASAFTNLGRLGLDLGDPHRALTSLGEAFDAWLHLGDLGEQSQVLVHRAATLGTLDRHDEAGDDVERAIALARRAGNDRLHASALLVAGWNQYLDNSPEGGLPFLDEAVRIFRRLGLSHDEAGALDRLGTVLAATGDRQAAIASYRAALQILGDDAGLRNVAESSVNLGCALIDGGFLQEAEARLDLASTFYEVSEDPKSVAQIAYCRARLEKRRGSIDEALVDVEESLEIVERLRDRARELGHSYLPIGLWQDYADLAIELHLADHAERNDPASLQRAFEALDRARAWTVFEQVAVARRQGNPPTRSESPGAEIEALKHSINVLAETRRRLREQRTGTARLSQVEASLRRLNLDLENRRAARRAAVKGAGSLEVSHSISVEEVQRGLPPGSALLAYHLADESRLFVLMRDSLGVWPLAPREDLEALAKTLYHSLHSRASTDDQWPLIARELGRELLPRGALPDHVDRLFLMVDGLLHYVPFAVLGSPRRASGDEAMPRLWLDDLTLSYVPSASVWLALDRRRRQRSTPPDTLAVFADPVFARDDDRLRQGEEGARLAEQGTSRSISPDRLPDGPLPRLPNSATEAEALLAMAAPEARDGWIGFSATKRAVLETDLSRFRIVHFATHAWIDERLPELSGFVLSRYDSLGQPLDGDLLVHEIRDLDLAADLAVLSGCQTALGKHVRGNGLVGLTHGFFDAGAGQVLVTLWGVDDVAAALFMPVFYEHMLVLKEEPAQALRSAQQWLRRQPGFERPYFWAEFALHGAP